MSAVNLHITLRKDRVQPGFFMLQSADGRLLHAGFCLGKADNAMAHNHDNAARRSILPYGDTPTGAYEPTKVIIFGRRHDRLGDGWIPIEGESGDALKARSRKFENGLPKPARSGLGIHAGRGDVRLVPTYGCIRMRDSDFKRVVSYIGQSSVKVIITEQDI